ASYLPKRALPNLATRIRRKNHFPIRRRFGENISSEGVTESTICLKDKIRIGSTLLEVSQGRMPCWKLNVRFDQHDMARRLQDTL
ncbi:MOSC domain-containing protein, partial [Vibrio parahaemolyticus]|nr:MOSC domain-containing protein [Vibrio parahaemolyticus]